jgi:hypothetical protein
MFSLFSWFEMPVFTGDGMIVEQPRERRRFDEIEAASSIPTLMHKRRINNKSKSLLSSFYKDCITDPCLNSSGFNPAAYKCKCRSALMAFSQKRMIQAQEEFPLESACDPLSYYYVVKEDAWYL